MKSLLENYSLPQNLMEDLREMVYEEELTHYENNNEFFAQLPLSPISTNSNMSDNSMPQPKVVVPTHDKNKKMIPILDLSKLNSSSF